MSAARNVEIHDGDVGGGGTGEMRGSQIQPELQVSGGFPDRDLTLMVNPDHEFK